MPTRVHWVYQPPMGLPRFDNAARAALLDIVRRKILDTATSAREVGVMVDRLNGLSRNFRKAIPVLLEMAGEMRLQCAKKTRCFRLPKRIRRSKSPIYVGTRL